MKNLKEFFLKEKTRELTKFKNDLNAEEAINNILDKWYYNDLIPRSSQNKKWETVEQLKKYLIGRKEKQTQKEIDKKLARLQIIEQAKDLEKIVINIEWEKSAMWGNNPTATAKVSYKDGTCEYFKSGSVGGCGYDKESTAVADAVNQSNSFLKLLYGKKNKNADKENRDVLGYGAGYGLFPYLEGGVGVSCYYKICESVGLGFEHLASGQKFDVYSITVK